MSKYTLGLDVGGAHLKAALPSRSQTIHRPFALWQSPQDLHSELQNLLESLPRVDQIALTMTGELCDCFANKREGVAHILNSVQLVAENRPVLTWSTEGRFLDVETARTNPLLVAAANWHALATWCGRFASEDNSLLIDVGSTTTDIIPLQNGTPCSQGKTDPERMQSEELVYVGVKRTPVCAVLGMQGSAEFFATMRDVYQILGEIPEDENDTDTADGRPATLTSSHVRLARMRCADMETMTEKQTTQLAEIIRDLQINRLQGSILTVTSRMATMPTKIILSGEGEFLIRQVLLSIDSLKNVPQVSLKTELGESVSKASCAFAVAVLAEEIDTSSIAAPPRF